MVHGSPSISISVPLILPPTSTTTSAFLILPSILSSLLFFSPLQFGYPFLPLFLLLSLLSSLTTLEMYAMLAIRTIRTEASHVEQADLSPHMSLATSGALLAEAFIVILTHGKLAVLLDVHVKAFISILTVAMLIIMLTLGHLPQVVFMEIITGITLLAQTFQPVFAYVVVVLSAEVVRRLLARSRMPIGASAAQGT